jgi:C4-type Zn-finger protein
MTNIKQLKVVNINCPKCNYQNAETISVKERYVGPIGNIGLYCLKCGYKKRAELSSQKAKLF